jgi:hypothetical protein
VASSGRELVRHFILNRSNVAVTAWRLLGCWRLFSGSRVEARLYPYDYAASLEQGVKGTLQIVRGVSSTSMNWHRCGFIASGVSMGEG